MHQKNEPKSARMGVESAVLGILFSALYGLSDEAHQYFVPGRDADVWDGMADLLGSIAGVAVYRRLVDKRGRLAVKGDRRTEHRS